jgi:hypothetical protein
MLLHLSRSDSFRTPYLFCIALLIALFILFMKISPTPHISLLNRQIVYGEDRNRISKIVHFVIGQEQNKTKSSFSFFNYLVFLAARRHIRPMKFFVHYYHEPNTFWWNQTKHDAEIDITLVTVRFVKTIFNRSIDHPAHRADVIRLEAILKYVGIYLDTDSLLLRSFDPLSSLNDVVLAYQDASKNLVASGVILAKPNAVFVRRWYDAYQSFNGKFWDCHSVVLVGRLASLYPNEVTVLPPQSFYRPHYYEPKKNFRVH